MAATFNQELFDAVVRHQIGLQRFSGSVRNRTWELLDAVEADIKRQILARAGRAGVDTPRRLRELDRLLEVVRETRVAAWYKVDRQWFEDARGLALAEPGFFDSVIASALPGVELGSTLPDAQVLRNIAKAQPFQGRTLREWARDIQRADLDRISQAIKIGMVQGEGPGAIARRVVGSYGLRGRDGVTAITRRQAESVVRTFVNGVGAEARREYAKLNKDLAPNEVFVATLDSRTTPICRRYDGQQFKVGSGPRLPLHMGERSLRVPVLDGEVVGDRPVRGFTEQSLVREYARENGLSSRLGRRASLPRGHKSSFDAFKRRRMRELTGRVPAKTTYTEFLRRQSHAIQDDILGPARAKLFRDGGLGLDKFVLANGHELTLAELAARHRPAFLRAGLNPALFAA